MPPDPRTRAMAASVAVSFLMLAGKIVAYLLTGSAAIFSDAAESVVHLLATSVAAFSLWYSRLPPDPQHPYGHGKIAYFSAGLEGALIFVAALSIFYTAGKALIEGPELRQLGWGLAITGGLALVNLGLGWWLIRVGRRENALVLVANGQHVLTDMWTSLGVIGGVVAVWLTGWEWLDPLVAIVLALNIVWTAGNLIRTSYEGLMEKVTPEASAQLVTLLEKAVAKNVVSGYHQLRHRRVNDQVWVEVHLLFPQELTIHEAHHRASHVEKALRDLFPQDKVHVTSHLEPDVHEDVHPGGHTLEDPLV